MRELPEWVRTLPQGRRTGPVPDAVLREAAALARELHGEYAQRRRRDYLRAVEGYLGAVSRGEAPPVPNEPDPVDETVEEAWIVLVARAFETADERRTRLELGAARSAAHWRRYELGFDIQVTSFHIAALRAQAAPYPHADV